MSNKNIVAIYCLHSIDIEIIINRDKNHIFPNGEIYSQYFRNKFIDEYEYV